MKINLSVIILSRNPTNLIPCAKRVLEKEPRLWPHRIVVVDDQYGRAGESEIHRFCRSNGIAWVKGAPGDFVFARNANLGIELAAPDDILLLNDDALLETESGFTDMWEMAQRHPEFGVIASTCNNVGNPRQMVQPAHLQGLREDPRMVCFTCVLIPRTTIDRVGLLDPIFANYGLDDDDYCLRVRKAGLKIGIWDACYVDHGSLKSSFRGDPAKPASFQENLEIYKRKWGEDNWGRPVPKAA